jgi:hypothetical protein
LLEGRRRHRRRFEHGGIGQCDLVRDGLALGCKRDCRPAASRGAVASIDERIEHEPEELML